MELNKPGDIMILSCTSRVFLTMASCITLLCVTGSMTSKHAEGLALHTFAANSTASSAHEEPSGISSLFRLDATTKKTWYKQWTKDISSNPLAARDVKASYSDQGSGHMSLALLLFMLHVWLQHTSITGNYCHHNVKVLWSWAKDQKVGSNVQGLVCFQHFMHAPLIIIDKGNVPVRRLAKVSHFLSTLVIPLFQVSAIQSTCSNWMGIEFISPLIHLLKFRLDFGFSFLQVQTHQLSIKPQSHQLFWAKKVRTKSLILYNEWMNLETLLQIALAFRQPKCVQSWSLWVRSGEYRLALGSLNFMNFGQFNIKFDA